MAKDDYASPGGALKLKGVKGSKIEKKKKKKAKANLDSEIAKEEIQKNEAELEKRKAEAELAELEGDEARKVPKDGEEDDDDAGIAYRTEAERRHEEMRKRRLDDRLKREGIKSHKERVEELNKYLSGLSEHHDMPRIGPG